MQIGSDSARPKRIYDRANRFPCDNEPNEILFRSLKRSIKLSVVSTILFRLNLKGNYNFFFLKFFS